MGSCSGFILLNVTFWNSTGCGVSFLGSFWSNVMLYMWLLPCELEFTAIDPKPSTDSLLTLLTLLSGDEALEFDPDYPDCSSE